MSFKRNGFILILIIVNILSLHSQSVGLVLSGGGAKGIAHIGVIQALEDNNIPIDFITGTSMGSIVGGLYASGYTPTEMMSLLNSREFRYWSTGKIDENLTYYYSKPKPSPSMLNLSFSMKDSIQFTSDILPKSLVNPLPMNFAFMDLFTAYTAQCGGEFNNLFVPFRCVASDVYHKRKMIFSTGKLGDAIRASMSFPIVFAPIKIDGVYAFDGGIYDNFPIDVMREDFAPSFTLGINVSSEDNPIDKDNLVDQIEAMIMQPQNDSISPEHGMRININLSKFGLLDFAKANEIYKVGYDKAMEMIDSIKSRVPRRVPKETVMLKRNVFKSQTPKVLFDSVSVSGGTKEQNSYIKFLFDKGEKNDTISMEDARISFYRAISSGKIKNLFPQANYIKKNNLFNLNLNATIGNKFGIGVGGYLTSSTNNMIYLTTKYETLSFNSFDANLSGWIGQSYIAGELTSKFALKTSFPSDIQFQGVISRQRFYESDILFYSNKLPTFILNYDYYLKVKYGVALGRKYKLETGLGYGFLEDFFYPSNVIDYSNTPQDQARYKLGQVYVNVNSSTLDIYNYATKGNSHEYTIIGVAGKNRYLPEGNLENTKYKHCMWAQFEYKGNNYWPISNKFVIGAKYDVLVSNKELFDNYNASIIQAPAFAPTPATQNYFNPAFRANSFAATGILPIWKYNDNLQLRGESYIFLPFRKIIEGENSKAEYGKWFRNPSFISQISAIYSFSNVALSLYCNYLSYPAKNWNFGISFGMLIPAQKFLR